MQYPLYPIPRTEIIEEIEQKSKRLIARYTKGRLLGKGGFARCYECIECDKGRVYAAKIIEKRTLTKPKTQQKLKSEIKIHSSLHHPRIVKFERFFEDSTCVYILLELCSQQTLMELLRRKRRLSETEAKFIMQQTLEGVKHMHGHNIIHRDLKLGNLFLNQEMEIKIGDFGLAAQLEFDGERKLTVCGTPNYIAPEILDGGKHGHSYEVDIWSLGVIMYTLLVGNPPFETNDVKTTYRKIRNNSYSFPEGVHVSMAAKNLIQRILQSCPENRPTLADLENDPWFACGEVPRLAPHTLFPASMQRQLPHDRQDPRELRKGKIDPVPREPLKPITNISPEEHHKKLSPPTRTRSDVLFRDRQLDLLKRAQSERELRQLAFPERDFRRELPPSLQQKPVLAQLPQPTSSEVPFSPLLGAGGLGFKQALVVAPEGPAVYCELPAPDPKKEELDEEEKADLTHMHQNLSVCIQHKPAQEPMAVATSNKPTVWVSEYSDFSAKYGLAFKLSNGHTGSAFNDGTKMTCDGANGNVEYIARNRDRTARQHEERTACTLEEYPESLKKKITLVTYFKSYFAKYKGKNVTYPIVVANANTSAPQHPPDQPFVYVKQWLKHSQAMVFRLSNKSFQVSFFDGTDILLSSEARMVTYTDLSGQSKTFALEMGKIPHKDVADRLEYTQKLLYQITHK
eukprot:NODE_323_length_2410_cov_13.563294_g301_i0.p1 GENE.NODE_323_length_2410_cov_13.563294_g301_i0~~NODE_323_length_2410_cov_13.563294_g301_i0.p1  ORF type:complete len:702 (+),score=150.91 NODE_323_length_2410_cov_13.563294_g301_i0:56-2107(+)